jgi:uncharacterized membrane protein YccC
MRIVQWLRAHDRGLLAFRRAGRTAIVMPALFALGDKVIGNAAIATFAAFGSFAMLLLVDFTGPMRDRLQAQAALAAVGALFICLGTLASRTAWLAAAAMACVAFGVLFAGVVSSALVAATPALLLAFILPVSLPGSPSAIPDRLAGWAMASVAALAAVALLWPAPARDPLRVLATTACRALAARLRSDVAVLIGAEGAPSPADHERVVEEAAAAVAALHQGFLATPYRPTGLSTSDRAIVRLVDELNWLHAVITSGPRPGSHPVNRDACAVKSASASVLGRGADLLEENGGSPELLDAALAELRTAVVRMEAEASVELPIPTDERDSSQVAPGDRVSAVVTALDPTFRAQELSFAVTRIAHNIELTAAAERRSWWQRMLGRRPAGVTSALTAAQERAAAHLDRHSVWLQTSVRGAVGLGLAVLVANLTGVQHSFWVVLGTLSVLRSNALSTGQTVLRGLLGTAAGFVVGAALLVPIGTNTALLWALLPLAVLLAGVLPAAISFAAGQAAFTVTLVILFNIIAPAGWQVGLLRIEDVAIGCAVSLLVGLLFWPRGAMGALRSALAEAYTDSARYLADAVDFGMLRCDERPPSTAAPTAPAEANVRAAAASRRLDDAFRTYLAERGPKPIPLADVTNLATGVVGLRLAADAVLDLWRRDDGGAGGDRAAARREILGTSDLVVGWYGDFATSILVAGTAPQPLSRALPDAGLVDALRRDLLSADGRTTSTAARMIWTGDYLDAVRRLQDTLVR